MGVIEFLFALAQDMILAAIPAVGFAMVFNVPVRALATTRRAKRAALSNPSPTTITFKSP
ncbi:hypothetical protein FV278_15205 [Escherichia coli]|nr:hypothetical protein FV278_15205 [Escherichia coli]